MALHRRRNDDLWEEAAKALPEEDLRYINIGQVDKRTILEDLLKIVEEKKKNGNEVVLHHVFSKIAVWIHKFRDIGDNAVQYDPHHAALPWAALRLVLQVIVNSIETNAAIADGIEYLSGLITQYAVVERLYLDTSSVASAVQIQGAIVRLYSSVLMFLAKARCYYGCKTSVRLVKSAVQPAEVAVASYLKKVEDAHAKANDLARLIDGGRIRILETALDSGMADTHNSLARLTHAMEEIKLEMSDSALKQQLSQKQSERIDIIKWLGATFTDQEYERALSIRNEQTCTWILENSQFRSWIANDANQNIAKFLWIHGTAGSGKTILCASVVDHLRRTASTPIMDYFCSFRYAETQEPFAILRSWIGQMVNQFEYVYNIAKAERWGNELRSATESELFRIFVAIISSGVLCTFVVDGFDECVSENGSIGSREDPRIIFLRRLTRSINQFSCRILLVSRNDVGISQTLANSSRESSSTRFYEHRISTQDNGADIKTFCHHIVDSRLGNKPQSLREYLSEQVASKSDGMFLWISLLSNRMSPGKNAKQLSELVTTTPSGLDEAYDRELRKIIGLEEEDRDRALLIIQWMLIAARPLTVREMTMALLAHGATLASDLIEGLPDAWDDLYVNDRIRKLCGSLIEIHPKYWRQPVAEQSVNFVHFSVKEYLLEPRHQWKCTATNIAFCDGHGQNCYSAFLCLRYLSFPDWSYIHSATKPGSLRRHKETLGFMAYSAREWYQHAHKSGVLSEQLVFLINDFFDVTASKWQLWSHLLDLRLQTLDGSLADWALEIIFPKSYNAPAKNQKPSALYHVVWLGFADTVRFLHNQKVDLNARGGKYGSALNAAAACGNEAAVQSLIQCGADVNLEAGTYRTALLTASAKYKGEHADTVVKHLIDAGADISRVDHRGHSVLHYLASYGANDSIKRLLDAGIDINARNRNGETALTSAMRSQRTESIPFLIRYGADIDAAENNGESALIVAVKLGSQPSVSLLLNYGADMRKKCNGRNALHYAAAGKDLLILTTLLDYGADPDEAKDVIGATSLTIAVANGSMPFLYALLAAQANPNLQDYRGCTALHVAVIEGRAEMIELLLVHGADVDVRDCYGRAPIHWAYDNPTVMNVLEPFCPSGQFVDQKKQLGILQRSIIAILDILDLGDQPEWTSFRMLGKHLQFANDCDEACTAYEQIIDDQRNHTAFCDGCNDSEFINGQRFVCCHCPDTDLCASCIKQFIPSLGDLLPSCRDHEFLKVPSEWWTIIPEAKVNVRGETLIEWLVRLRNKYALDEEEISS